MIAPRMVATARGPVEAAVVGEGPAFLALHGGMGGWDQSWLLARALLGDRIGAHRVIAVSRPGYLSTALAAGASPEDQADLCAALLDTLRIERAAVAAVSAGGPSALHVARRHPGRVAGLILVSACTGRLAIPPEILSRMRFMAALARVPGVTALMRWKTARDPLAAATRAIADPDLRASTLADPQAGPLLRALQLSVFDDLRRRLPGTVNDMTRFRALDPFPVEGLAVPVLAIHGTADRVVPFAHAQAVAPPAALLSIAGGEHVALFTHLRPVRDAAAEFLARV